MRILKIILVTIILGGLTVPAVGCASETDTAPQSENQVVTVERGNLRIDITASGNLALSRKEDPAFEVSGTQQEPLTVEEVLVEEGDTVEEGQVLVTLDTTALEQKVTSREQTLKTAELAVTTAELTVTTAEIDLQTAKDAEETVRATEIDLETATDNFRKIAYPYTYSTFAFDVPAAITAIHDAERQLAEAKAVLEIGPDSEEYGEAWHKFRQAQDNLVIARERLLRGKGVEQFIGDNPDEPTTAPLATTDFWTLRATQLAKDKAQISLEKAKNSFQSGLDKANIALDKAIVALDKANVALEEARDDLDTAKDELEKAVVVAPFAGFITKVNVEGGDEVRKGTVAAQVADPDKFEAEVMVGEMDIMQVMLGADASVQVDAMPEISLPAKVTHISPTATIQSGVVNYTVKVELQALQAVQQEQEEAGQQAIQQMQQGELPPRLKQAIEEGRITQEQAEEMIKQMQQGQGGQPQGQRPSVIPADFQLREGLTVTVSILVKEKNDVLMIPNRAVTREGSETYVQVQKDGVVEKRSIKTGISNWTHTEVTEGLSEGEQVVIGQASTTTSQAAAPRSPMPFMPGMRRTR